MEGLVCFAYGPPELVFRGVHQSKLRNADDFGMRHFARSGTPKRDLNRLLLGETGNEKRVFSRSICDDGLRITFFKDQAFLFRVCHDDISVLSPIRVGAVFGLCRGMTPSTVPSTEREAIYTL